MNAILIEQFRMLFNKYLHLPKGMDPNAHTLHVPDYFLQTSFRNMEEFLQ